ncbi:hypothetical protein [Amycolatopsis sp. NPDC051371]|uniref:hypothetical protein n=1 Tax=Amycolatopsis sp. NPDC051371 TaxID=3155800 RepID=UPI00343AE19A
MDEDYARKLRAWLRAEPGTTPRRAEEEREWFREVPAPASGDRDTVPAADGGWVRGEQPPASGEPGPASGDAGTADDRKPVSQPDSERWSVRGQLPEGAQPEADDEWVCPVIVLPVPRSSRENGCRLSGPGERPRIEATDHPAEPRVMSEAEARSRRNHPSNWHRRRREAREARETEEREPGSR